MGRSRFKKSIKKKHQKTPHTNSTTRKRTKVVNRSVNPAVDNLSKLSHEEYSEDTKNSDNVHHFIARETTASDKNKKHVFRAAIVETLTDFIQEAVNILNTYEDTAFEDFFHVVDEEIRRYHYKDCKFSELMENHDTRKFLAEVLTIIRGKPVSLMKVHFNEMADIMKDKTYGKDVAELLDYINYLYRYAEQKFHTVLKELKHYKKTKSIKAHNNLVKVIRRGIRDIFFDHYTAFDSNTRRELKERIEKFWKQFKKNPASNAEVNDSHEKNIAVAEDKEPERDSKNDPQINLKNKKDRKSEENDHQPPQDKETEKDDSSNKSEMLNTDYTKDEISSGQSFDSSSNSIKQSQERHEEYRTQRYMTLYTEDISYKARTTKKTEIMPISAKEMTKKATVPKRPTTTSAPRYSSEDESVGSKQFDTLRSNNKLDFKQDIFYSGHNTQKVLTVKLKPESRITPETLPRKHNKSDEPLKPKSKHGIVHVIGEYNAVIDVQLANTDLLKSLGIFKPVPDNNFRYGTTSYQRTFTQTKSVPTRPKIQYRGMQAGVKTKSKKRALTKPPLRFTKTLKSIYLNRLSDMRSNTLLPEDINYIRNTIKNEKRKQNILTRRNANSTVLKSGALTNVPKNFNEYLVKRLDALEQDLKDFRSMLYENHTHEVELNNVTDEVDARNKNENKRKDFKDNDLRLNIENHDLNKEEHNKRNNDGHSARSSIKNTESSTKNTYSNENVTKKIALNTTVIDNKIAPQVASNNVNDIKGLNKSKSVTTVTIRSFQFTDTIEIKPFETTPASTKSTTHDYYNLRYQLDHINDGIDLNM